MGHDVKTRSLVTGFAVVSASLVLAAESMAQTDEWLGNWGAPCGTNGQVISFSRSKLDLSGMEMMCDIQSVERDGNVYTFTMSCQGHPTSMAAKVDGNRLEFVRQQQGFEFDPKRFTRC